MGSIEPGTECIWGHEFERAYDLDTENDMGDHFVNTRAYRCCVCRKVKEVVWGCLK